MMRWSSRTLARLLLLLTLATAFAVAIPVHAAASDGAVQASEQQVKAAFVFKFGGYVQWPPAAFENPRSPLVIGVLSNGELADELTRIARGRSVEGRPVLVRKLRRDQPLDGVHVLFVSQDGCLPIAGALAAGKGLPALTVTDAPAGIGSGCMINFVLVDDKIRFDVALAPAEASGLKISSQLLAVARNVRAATP